MTGSILVVEDEVDLAEVLRYNLEREGYSCRVAADGNKALTEIQRRPPDLVLLDRMLPAKSGDEVASELKGDPQTASLPIVMLTAKDEVSDQLMGFALGADDYVTKPFSMKLLLARVASVLRRATPADRAHEVLTVGPIRLDRSRHELAVDGKSIPLTATEFRLLHALMVAGGRVLSRGQLIGKALGSNTVVTDRTIDVHVTSLRRKLGPAANWIHTVRGVGYACRPPA
jgi:two-component system phosphate regulon response regulator PhoB